MADPFNVTSGNDPWRNLMAFGLSTMQAANARTPSGHLAYGTGPLGPIGAGGTAAMDSARQNAMAHAQTQLYGAEAQGKIMANAVSLNQINLQRMAMGLPPLSMEGVPSITPGVQQQPGQAAPLPVPQGSSTGMPFSPTAGSSVRSVDQGMITRPAAGGSAAPAQTQGAGMMQGFDPQRMLTIGMGYAQPESPQEAAAAGYWAHSMGLTDRAKQLNDFALKGPIAGQEAWGAAPAKVWEATQTAAGTLPYKKEEIDYTPRDIPAGGALMRNGQIMARGAQEGTAPDGTPYRVPAQMTTPTQGTAPAQNAPLGIRNNNPGNIRPNGDQWQGMTGQSDGYLTFQTPQDGIRATAMNLRSYADQGVNTPATIAARWAPASDKNDPVAYGKNLSAMLGIKPDQAIDLNDPMTNLAVTQAIMQQENGMIPYDMPTISAGVQAAFAPQAGAAPNVPANSSIPAGAVQTGLSPTEKSYQEKRGTDLASTRTEIDEHAEAAKNSLFMLDEMDKQADSFRMGKGAGFEQEAKKYFRLINPKFDESVGNYEAFLKNAIKLTNEEVRQVSSRAAVQEYQAIQSAQPQPDMSPEGYKVVTNQMRAVQEYKLAKQQAANNWTKPVAQGGLGNKTLEGFETEFNKKVSPSVFIVARLAETDPKALAKVRENLLKQQGGEARLKKLMDKIRYAQAEGYLE